MKTNTTATPATTDPVTLDARYRFSYEYVGHATPYHVARFCDSWIGCAPTLEEARQLARDYETNRWSALFTPPAATPNPIAREVTRPGRTDGVRVFEREDGTTTLFDPARSTVATFQKATGLPLPPFAPSPDLHLPPPPLKPAMRFVVPTPESLAPADNLPSVQSNAKSRLYIIRNAGGVSHYGWDVIEHKTVALIAALHLPECRPATFPVGTVEAYELYTALMATARARYESTGQPFTFELSPQLIGLEGCRVEVIDKPGDTPRRFKVGKSTGWIPCHLELHNARSSGGGPAHLEYASVRTIG